MIQLNGEDQLTMETGLITPTRILNMFILLILNTPFWKTSYVAEMNIAFSLWCTGANLYQSTRWRISLAPGRFQINFR